MSDLLELIVSAAASGSIYGLVALAYLMILRPTGIINFAVGEWVATGAFLGVVMLTAGNWTVLELPYIVALVAIVLVMAVIGWCVDVLTVRPLVERGAHILSPILALLGVLVIFRESIALIFGADNFSVPSPFGFKRLEIGPFAGTPQHFTIIVATASVFAAVWLFAERTLWGKAFQAVAINRRAASLMGINLGMVTALAFAGGAAVAGIAGLLVSPLTSAHYLMGLPLAIQGFSALVVGGVARVEGALLGGFVLAMVEQLAARYLPIPSGFTLGAPLVLMILFLLVRPSGILKPKEARA
jgi:branched-chain amino acid transport system permease protein